MATGNKKTSLIFLQNICLSIVEIDIEQHIMCKPIKMCIHVLTPDFKRNLILDLKFVYILKKKKWPKIEREVKPVRSPFYYSCTGCRRTNKFLMSKKMNFLFLCKKCAIYFRIFFRLIEELLNVMI